MEAVRPNHHPAARVFTGPISLRDLLLFDQDPIDVVVVFDHAGTRLQATESPLQRVENIFESIVDVMDEETLSLLQEEQHDYLEGIGGTISDSSLLRGVRFWRCLQMRLSGSAPPSASSG